MVAPDGLDLSGLLASQRLRVCCNDAALAHSYANVRQFCIQNSAQPISAVVRLPSSVATAACQALPGEMVRSVPLLLRGLPEDLVPRHPVVSLVASWRRDHDVRRLAQVARLEPGSGDRWADIALELPRRGPEQPEAPEYADEADEDADTADPIRLIKGLRFADYLKDHAKFSEAMAASRDFDAPSADEGARDASRDPKSTKLRTAYKLLDVTGMLIQRREIKADRLCNRAQSINLYSDSSPVTGEEFQGMIMETIFYDRERPMKRDVLPGSTLSYGQFNWACKSMALLFALFLVAGPFFSAT